MKDYARGWKKPKLPERLEPRDSWKLRIRRRRTLTRTIAEQQQHKFDMKFTDFVIEFVLLENVLKTETSCPEAIREYMQAYSRRGKEKNRAAEAAPGRWEGSIYSVASRMLERPTMLSVFGLFVTVVLRVQEPSAGEAHPQQERSEQRERAAGCPGVPGLVAGDVALDQKSRRAHEDEAEAGEHVCLPARGFELRCRQLERHRRREQDELDALQPEDQVEKL